MSIITQFPNHVAYRISLLQTAQPAFILKRKAVRFIFGSISSVSFIYTEKDNLMRNWF